MRPTFIKLPRNSEEIRETQNKFYEIAWFPRVISGIDGSHIRIQSPGGNTAEEFRNRKGYFSFNVQAMCNADFMFQDIVARWPGSSHDSMIFAYSSIKFYLENGEFGNGIVLGDSGYAQSNFLLILYQNLSQELRVYTMNLK